MTAATHKWFVEYTGTTQTHMFGVKEFLVSRTTSFQQVEIADTCDYGRILVLDGKIQSAAFDEYIYHETLIHPAMLTHPQPRRVMLIGGGEGASIREILKHPSVERVLMVDIDREVVELCRQHLPEWHRGSFEDPRVELIYADARGYLEQNDECFDTIYCDLPEPLEGTPSKRLYTKQFYALLYHHLDAGGMIALQAGDFSPVFVEAHFAICNSIRTAFPSVYSYHAFVPSFNTVWGFALALRDGGALAVPEEIDHRIGVRGLTLDFYDGETHRGLFAMPKDIRRRYEASNTVIDDDHLLVTS